MHGCPRTVIQRSLPDGRGERAGRPRPAPLRGRRTGLATAVLLLVSLATSMIAPPAAAEPAIVDLGVLPGGYFSTAHDINNAGQIVGQSDASNASYAHPILWQDGMMLDLGTRGSGFGVAYGINDRGQVVGWTGIPFTPYTGAFLWEDGVMTDILRTNDRAYKINEDVQVVGSSNPSPSVAALLWEDGVTTTIAGGYAWDINERRQVAGTARRPMGSFCVYAFVWEGGTLTDLSDGTSCGSRAYAINDAGQVVGISGGRAVLWDHGATTDLGTLGADESQAADINNLGQIVGTRFLESGLRLAFLWEDGTMKDLETLPGGSWSTAYAINDLGQVVGAGDNETGDVHAVLWPDPAAVHDVAVTSSFADAVVAFAGTPVTVHATVRNEGNRAETFDVLAFAGSDVVGAVTVKDLAPGASGRVSITWDTSGHAAGLYAIRVEVVPVDQETDVADNAHSDDSVVLLPSPIGILGFP